jgi:hypothetical protein
VKQDRDAQHLKDVKAMMATYAARLRAACADGDEFAAMLARKGWRLLWHRRRRLSPPEQPLDDYENHRRNRDHY